MQKLRAICDKHGILLIFDEVITGFGRLGTPFGAQYFDVMPDIITTAKGLTNGAIPMGAVFVRKQIYDAFMKARTASSSSTATPTRRIQLRAPPVSRLRKSTSAKDLLTRGAELAKAFEDAVHSLRSAPNVIDIRNLGLVAGIELQSRRRRRSARVAMKRW